MSAAPHLAGGGGDRTLDMKIMEAPVITKCYALIFVIGGVLLCVPFAHSFTKTLVCNGCGQHMMALVHSVGVNIRVVIYDPSALSITKTLVSNGWSQQMIHLVHSVMVTIMMVIMM